MLAFDLATGNIAWETKRSAISWASPICVEVGGRKELIVADSTAAAGYDPSTGMELWREACLSGEVAPSPAYAAGMVFVGNQYATGAGIRIASGQPELVWKWEENLPDTASPLATSNYVFFATSGGTLTCLDAQKGTVVWAQDLGTGFYASPILVGNAVYALDREGVMHIVAAAPEYKLLGQCALGEKADATPAFVDGRIYIRGAEHLFCIGE